MSAALTVAVLVTSTAACSGLRVQSEVPAVDALMRMYDQRSGVWPTTGWWNSANAVTAVEDYMLLSGDRRHLWMVANTFSAKRFAADGAFVNRFIDDTGWWALAWIRAYDLTGDPQYLDTARVGVDFMWRHHDNTCGGGLWWTTSHQYKNAIANELFVKAAAQLAVRLPGPAAAGYLEQARSVWDWFDASGMIGADLLVNDGLDPATCRNNGDTTWTYNQGVLLGALVDLAQATGDQDYLDRARELADASTTSDRLHVDGVLTEPCEAGGCDINGPSFKGIYVRNLGELDRALPDHPYRDYLTGQAATAYEHNRTSDNQYGLHWAGPIQDISAASQQSAVDLLVAAQPINDPPATSTADPAKVSALTPAVAATADMTSQTPVTGPSTTIAGPHSTGPSTISGGPGR